MPESPEIIKQLIKLVVDDVGPITGDLYSHSLEQVFVRSTWSQLVFKKARNDPNIFSHPL